MMDSVSGSGGLRGRRVALPESRELDLLERMLRDRGAQTLRCPLVSIIDAPDQAPVKDWLGRLCAGRMDDLVLFTGEGVRRLSEAAARAGCHDAFVAALGGVRKITRGPKPVRVLRELGLGTDIAAPLPTTEGIIEALGQLELDGRTVAVQLYGDEPNAPLQDYLRARGAAVDPVAPYVYASAADTGEVRRLIDVLISREVDAIAFTAQTQVERLLRVARRERLEQPLRQAFDQVVVAAIGPLVRDALLREGIVAQVTPPRLYFMKPMIRALDAHFSAGAARG